MKKLHISALSAMLITSFIMIPQVKAQDIVNPAQIVSTSDLIWLNFDDTDFGSSREWSIETNHDTFKIYDDVDDLNHNFKKIFEITHSLSNENSFIVDTSGDINLADGSVFVDRSADYVGIGTSTPQAELHVMPGGDGFIFNATSSRVRIEADDSSDWSLTAYKFTPIIIPGLPTPSPTNKFYLRDNNASTRPFEVYSGAPTGSLVIPKEGGISSTFSGDAPTNDDPVLKGLMNLITISSNNTDASKTSDVSFALKNARENFKWNFRTFAPGEGFLATKEGTGGGEFRIDNTTDDFTNAKMVVGGVTVFENGHLVTASSRELKTDIKPLDTRAALDAFHKLQPVSYEYKAQKGEPVVGFIAEDIPELVAMPSRKSLDSTEIVAVLTSVVKEQEKQLKIQAEKIEKLEKMQKRLAKVESLLTNLALETSNTKTEKVSLNIK